MESRGNAPTYAGQYVERFFRSAQDAHPSLQRYQRRSRIAQLGSLVMVECRL